MAKMRGLWVCLLAGGLSAAALPGAAQAQKFGGTLKTQNYGNPPSLSIHEEATVGTVVPMMPVFNNLVIYDQHVPQTSLESIRPELATEWRWSDDRTQLTFKLQEGVKWHDGKPFSAADVKCTWDMLSGKSDTKLRRNPREIWYRNPEEVTVNGDHEVTFRLSRPQPAFLAMLAAGVSPVYPCHVDPAQMRTKPIGTGPFKFADYRQNEGIYLKKNENYWKKDRPYLDGITYRIISSTATRQLSFIAGEDDMTFPTDVSMPLLKDIQTQAPNAQCTVRRLNVSNNLLVNRDAPPFDNPELRRAMALTLDRNTVNSIINEGKGGIGGALLPPPDGQWGLPPEQLEGLPGFAKDVEKSREEARAIMEKLGYGPDNRLKVQVITRNAQTYRDSAVLFLDQISHIYMDGELKIIETGVWYNTLTQKKFAVGLNQTGTPVDDPDTHLFENYACDSVRNYTNYCNRDLEKLFEKQSLEPDAQKRKEIVWQIDRTLQEEVARPVFFHNVAAGCWHPQVKNYTIQTNSIYNGWRFEDLWLDR